MLIIGANGFAKELLEVCYDLEIRDEIVFYDDISINYPDKLFGKYRILKSKRAAAEYFLNEDNRYALGLGNPFFRQKMYKDFSQIGGKMTSLISPKAQIGTNEIFIGEGATILANAHITSSVKIGKGLLMYPNSIITHDCEIGDFVELSPGATVLGGAVIRSLSHLGANSTILPKLIVGEGCIVGAGAVVTKEVMSSSTVKGNPAK